MQAIFRFHGNGELVISNTPGGIMVEDIETRFCSQPPTKEDQQLLDRIEATRRETQQQIARGESVPPVSGFDWYLDTGTNQFRRTVAILSLSKSQARSVASAMMQAAAGA